MQKYSCLLYLRIKEYVKIYSVNPLHLIFRNVNGYFEEINKSRPLTLVLTNERRIFILKNKNR